MHLNDPRKCQRHISCTKAALWRVDGKLNVCGQHLNWAMFQQTTTVGEVVTIKRLFDKLSPSGYTPTSFRTKN